MKFKKIASLFAITGICFSHLNNVANADPGQNNGGGFPVPDFSCMEESEILEIERLDNVTFNEVNATAETHLQQIRNQHPGSLIKYSINLGAPEFKKDGTVVSLIWFINYEKIIESDQNG